MQSVSRISSSLLGRLAVQQGSLRSLLVGSQYNCVNALYANFATKAKAPSISEKATGGAKDNKAKGCNANAAQKDKKGTNQCGAKDSKGAASKDAKAKGAGNKKAEIKLEKIPVDKLKDVIEHQKRSFYCNDPVAMALGMCEDVAALKVEMERTKKIIEEGLSVMALVDGKVVAAHVNGRMCPGTAEKDLARPDNPKNAQEKIQYLKATANAKVDLFKKFGVDAIYDMKMVSVDEDYTCPNVAFQAIKLEEKIAREAGFQLIKAEASSIYGEDLLEKLGFQSVSETRYDRVTDSQCKVLIPVKEPNTRYTIMVKKL